MTSLVLTNSNVLPKEKHKLSLKLNNPMNFNNCVVCLKYIDFFYGSRAVISLVDSVLVHCNLVNSRDQLKNSLIYSFIPNDLYHEFKPDFIYLVDNKDNGDFAEIEVWFTDQDCNTLDMHESKIKVELQITPVEWVLNDNSNQISNAII